jgi:hypothetical protein
MVNQPDPVKQAVTQALIQDKVADANKKNAEAGKAQTAGILNIAKARTEGMPDAQAPPPSPLDVAERLANINETNATAQHKRASANSLEHKALLSPLQMLADHAQQNADRALEHHHRTLDRETQRESKNDTDRDY